MSAHVIVVRGSLTDEDSLRNSDIMTVMSSFPCCCHRSINFYGVDGLIKAKIFNIDFK